MCYKFIRQRTKQHCRRSADLRSDRKQTGNKRFPDFKCRFCNSRRIFRETVSEGFKQRHTCIHKIRHIRGEINDHIRCNTAQRRDHLADAADNRLDTRNDVAGCGRCTADQIVNELFKILLIISDADKQICERCLCHCDRSADRFSCFSGSRAGDAHFRLNDVDRLHDIRITVKIILDTGDRLRISKQPLHLRFRTAIAELQVIEHRVVLLCESLIGVLDALHAGAHLVRIVCHVRDCTVCDLRSLRSIAVQRCDQRRRKARDRIHVLILRHSGSSERFSRILHHGILCGDQVIILALDRIDCLADALRILFKAHVLRAEQCRNAAGELLVFCVCFECLCAERCHSARCCGDCTRNSFHTCFGNASELRKAGFKARFVDTGIKFQCAVKCHTYHSLSCGSTAHRLIVLASLR